MMDKTALPQEHILELSLNGELDLTLICSNDSLPELITGYLYNEGLINQSEDILSLDLAGDGSSAKVSLAALDAAGTHVVRASGLGSPLLTIKPGLCRRPVLRRYSKEYILSCAADMDSAARIYSRTGGVHCAALFDGQRRLSLYEDIGRHNTLDKLTGDRLLRRLDTADTLLLTTGRISGDMVRKAGKTGVSCIASYSTATSLALEYAESAGITLIAYIKGGKFAVYCGEERLA